MAEKREIKIVTDSDYKRWILSLKDRVRSAQIKASIAVNEEMLELYWNIGKDISELHLEAAYGSHFFETVSRDLRAEFPDAQGFSERNIRYMKQFYLFYREKLHQLGAEFDLYEKLFVIPWRHHIEIFTRSKSVDEALFFIEKTKENGWSRAMLVNMMDTKLYETRGTISSSRTSTRTQSGFSSAKKRMMSSRSGRSKKVTSQSGFRLMNFRQLFRLRKNCFRAWMRLEMR